MTHQDVALSIPLPFETNNIINVNFVDLDECPVCLETLYVKNPYSSSYIEKLQCGHYFCKSCVQKLEKSSEQLGCFPCPCCRQIQHRSKYKLVRILLIFYSKFHQEIAIFLAIMCWISGLAILLVVLLAYQDMQNE